MKVAAVPAQDPGLPAAPNLNVLHAQARTQGSHHVGAKHLLLRPAGLALHNNVAGDDAHLHAHVDRLPGDLVHVGNVLKPHGLAQDNGVPVVLQASHDQLLRLVHVRVMGEDHVLAVLKVDLLGQVDAAVPGADGAGDLGPRADAWAAVQVNGPAVPPRDEVALAKVVYVGRERVCGHEVLGAQVRQALGGVAVAVQRDGGRVEEGVLLRANLKLAALDPDVAGVQLEPVLAIKHELALHQQQEQLWRGHVHQHHLVRWNHHRVALHGRLVVEPRVDLRPPVQVPEPHQRVRRRHVALWRCHAERQRVERGAARCLAHHPRPVRAGRLHHARVPVDVHGRVVDVRARWQPFARERDDGPAKRRAKLGLHGRNHRGGVHAVGQRLVLVAAHQRRGERRCGDVGNDSGARLTRAVSLARVGLRRMGAHLHVALVPLAEGVDAEANVLELGHGAVAVCGAVVADVADVLARGVEVDHRPAIRGLGGNGAHVREVDVVRRDVEGAAHGALTLLELREVADAVEGGHRALAQVKEHVARRPQRGRRPRVCGKVVVKRGVRARGCPARGAREHRGLHVAKDGVRLWRVNRRGATHGGRVARRHHGAVPVAHAHHRPLLLRRKPAAREGHECAAGKARSGRGDGAELHQGGEDGLVSRNAAVVDLHKHDVLTSRDGLCEVAVEVRVCGGGCVEGTGHPAHGDDYSGGQGGDVCVLWCSGIKAAEQALALDGEVQASFGKGRRGRDAAHLPGERRVVREDAVCAIGAAIGQAEVGG